MRFSYGCQCCTGSGVITACCPGAVPNNLTLTVTRSLGTACGCLVGTYSLVWDGTQGAWVWTGTVCGVSFEWFFSCNTSFSYFQLSGGVPPFFFPGCAFGDAGNGNAATLSCSPFHVTGAFSPQDPPATGHAACPCGSTADLFNYDVTG